jgi:microcystin-dependent protein
VAFETAFASQTPSGTTNAIALTIAQMPAHTHTQQLPTSNGAAGSSSGSPVSGVTGVTSSSTGGGATHSHAFSGNAINLDVSYINIILCSKD